MIEHLLSPYIFFVKVINKNNKIELFLLSEVKLSISTVSSVKRSNYNFNIFFKVKNKIIINYLVYGFFSDNQWSDFTAIIGVYILLVQLPEVLCLFAFRKYNQKAIKP